MIVIAVNCNLKFGSCHVISSGISLKFDLNFDQNGEELSVERKEKLSLSFIYEQLGVVYSKESLIVYVDHKIKPCFFPSLHEVSGILPKVEKYVSCCGKLDKENWN